MLFKVVRLAGQERFVRLDLSLDDDTVSRHLISVFKYDQIIDDQLIDRHTDLLSVAHGSRPVRRDDGQFIKCLLCADLLKNTDAGIDDGGSDKQTVPEGTDQNDHHKQDDI